MVNGHCFAQQLQLTTVHPECRPAANRKEHALELHFFGAEVDLVRIVVDESLEDANEALILVKKRRYLRT